MSKPLGSPWTVVSAKLGAVVWAALAVLVFSHRSSMGAIELLFLLAPLVIVPLGFEVLDRHGGMYPLTLGRVVRILQPFATALVVVSFWFPAGTVAGALSSAWLAVGALTALMAVLDLFRPGAWALDRLVINVARVDLAIAGGWFVSSRLGIAPMGFSEPIVLLTGVHFHYSGFATALLAAVTLKFCERRPKFSGIARPIAVAAVCVPFLLAAGFVFSPTLKLICALILAITLAGFSLLQFSLASGFEDLRARMLLRIAAGLLIPGMLLVAVYALGEYTGKYWLVIPQMAHLHGPLNGPGFITSSLLAWAIEKPYRAANVLRPVGEVCCGTTYFSDARRVS